MPRPSTPLLDRERIADAALAVTDRTGQLTVTALAKELHVGPSALYHHVRGRDEIVALMRERMARLVDSSGFADDDWQPALRRWAASYRTTFATWPGIVTFMATEPVADPVLHAMYEDVIDGLERAGFRKDDVLSIVTAVESFVLGSVLDLVAPGVMIDEVDAEATPLLREAVGALPPGRKRADRAFAIGLDALVAGLEAVLASTPKRRSTGRRRNPAT